MLEIIQQYVFENERGQTVTVGGDRYMAMISNFLWSELEDINLKEMWRNVQHSQRNRSGLQDRDLTPLDYFNFADNAQYIIILLSFVYTKRFKCLYTPLNVSINIRRAKK